MLVGLLLLGAVLDLVMLLAGPQVQRLVGVSDEHVLDRLLLPVWAGWVTLYVIAAVVVLVDAIRRVRRRDLDGLQRAATVVKLGAIPFFVVNFVLLGVGGLVASMMAVGVVLVVLFVVGTYLVMLPTSVYGVACLVLLLRGRAIGPAFFAVNLVLHLLFVVDVVSTLVVAFRARQVLAAAPPGLTTPGISSVR